MADTTIVGDNIGVVQAPAGVAWSAGWSGVSWGAVIGGALTAIAVTIIVIALGSGIGLTLASPYSVSPSAGTLTVLGAVWLVFAQAIGFATGGYVAGRLRREPLPLHDGETKFRDGANGLVVWAIGVVVSALMLASAAGNISAAAATSVTAGATAATATAAGQQLRPIDYFADTLLRTTAQNASTASGSSPSNSAANDEAARAQIDRILVTSIGPSGISNDDRTYLAQIVSARTGLSPDDAQKRVDDVVSRAKAALTQAAETARKAAAYLSFWTFMSLLFGAVCATLGGILGGDLRDEFAIKRYVSTAPR